MSERAILAYFHTPEQAEAVAAKLKAMRAIDLQIDRISRYPGEAVDEPVNPITGNITSLAGLTMDADISERSAGILMAADPSASGMSDGGQGGPTGRDILLTAVMDESTFHQALKLIRDSGGMA
ncbi:hypothetical protein J31TS4_28650 [Paenibacillus sp. J31TS4]|uniref:hypothetical protein n=1 Tax=Paenibacillus sp. J31TS4 TaxID=2807195 RepID=UPI001AFD3DCF|nr:hypothetical protein [Paenibacillus sp. J31TS4]GIP39585.1 hypothetical protein J31TS4_28650 [Paenibacillus sp. J31TS4]